jgi:hypothetical protein
MYLNYTYPTRLSVTAQILVPDDVFARIQELNLTWTPIYLRADGFCVPLVQMIYEDSFTFYAPTESALRQIVNEIEERCDHVKELISLAASRDCL